MSLSDFQIQFVDCHLNRDERKKIRQIAELIYLSSPSDSNLTLKIQKQPTGFLASSRLASFHGVHEDRYFHGDPIEAVAGLRESMDMYFYNWRKTRFSDENRAS